MEKFLDRCVHGCFLFFTTGAVFVLPMLAIFLSGMWMCYAIFIDSANDTRS